MKALQNLFLHQLGDIYYAEDRFSKLLPRMADIAADEELRIALHHHLSESESQRERLQEVFHSFGKRAQGRKSQAVNGLVREAELIGSKFGRSSAADRALIAAAQKLKYYELATYGCLIDWSTFLENETAAELLREIMDQEEAANDTLMDIAENGTLPNPIE